MQDPLSSNDWLQWLFLGAAALCVLFHVVRGWRRGVMRQFIYLLALALSYPIAWLAGPMLVPALRSLGYPDFVLSAVAGSAIALIIFLVVTIIGAILFKKTSQQDVGIIKLAYGFGGSALGLVSGLAIVWLMVIIIRLFGSMAESQIAASRIAARNHHAATASASAPGAAVTIEASAQLPPPNPVVLGIAQMKHSLDHGIAGPVLKEVDPIPEKIHELIGKSTAILADPERSNRFLHYPGAQEIAANPKVIALRDDPDIIKQARARDFMALMKNEKLVAVANDPKVLALLKKFEFEKALDYSLSDAKKEAPADNGQ